MKALIAAIILLVPFAAKADDVVNKLQDISVTIRSGSGFMSGQGSGTLYTRWRGKDTVTFVWTAAHVVDNLRKTRKVIVNGSERTVVEFEDAAIVQEFKQNGRRIGEMKMEAKVIRYSDAQQGEDLALLMVRKINFVPAYTTAKFYLSDQIPDIGTELFHVGSLLGQVGSNSLTTGVISQIGRVLDLGANGVIFDQTTATAFPGSSGGGVYLKTGEYVGMVVRGAGEGFNFIVPARRIRAWAKSAGIEWAVDPSVALPTEEEIAKMPVEDAGVAFASGYDKSKSSFQEIVNRWRGKYNDVNREFPFLIVK